MSQTIVFAAIRFKVATIIYAPIIQIPQYEKNWNVLSVCDNWPATWQNQQSDCAPSEDSDQPGHPPSLIRIFAVRMMKVWTLSYPLRDSEDSDQTGRMPRLIWVFAGRTLTLFDLSCRGSYLLSIVALTNFGVGIVYSRIPPTRNIQLKNQVLCNEVSSSDSTV